MFSINLHLKDRFSGALHLVTKNVTPDILLKLIHIFTTDGTINQFDQQINWNWKILKIKINSE